MATLDDLLASSEDAVADLHQIVALLNRGAAGGGNKSEEGEEKKGGGLLSTLSRLSVVTRAAVDAITGLAFASLAFVKALNPGLAALFNQELQNLYATIGGALEPVIQTAIPIIRQLAALFLDLSQELRPIIADIADAFGSVFIAVVRLVTTNLKVWLTLLSPLVKLIALQMNLVAQLVEVWTALIKTVLEVITEFLSSIVTIRDVNDALKAFEGWINRCAGVLAEFAGHMLVLFGLTDLLDKFRAGIKKAIDAKIAPAGGLLAAPAGATTGGIEGIATKFAEKAFAASAGAATKKPEVGLLEEILKGLTDARAKPMDFKQVIVDALKEFFPEINSLKVGKALDIASGGSVVTTVDVARRRAREAATFSPGGSWGAEAGRELSKLFPDWFK